MLGEEDEESLSELEAEGVDSCKLIDCIKKLNKGRTSVRLDLFFTHY